MKALLLSALLAAPAAAGERLVVKDAGGFDPAGRGAEFADRFGWTGYEAEFSFSLEDGALADTSRLEIAIARRGGSKIRFTCRTSKEDLAARVVPGLGGRVSVIAECRVKPKAFAKAVDLDAEDVGAPAFVFEAVLEGSSARAGGQRGLRFRPDRPVAALALGPYAENAEAAGLAVVFSAR